MRQHQLPFLFAAVLALLPQDPPQPAPVAPPAPAEPPAKAPQWTPATLARLAWISGTWTLRDGERTTEEHWRPLQGTTLLGSSHTFDQQRTHFFEHLRVEAQRGTIAYLASPGGAAPTAFQLTVVEDGLAVFENREHDYPQRIRYERTAAGMTATISRLDGSRAVAFVFTKR